MPQHALGGHYGGVVDMGWDASGRCLHTVSEDQTSRIFSACRSHWCEIARPQVSLPVWGGVRNMPRRCPYRWKDLSSWVVSGFISVLSSHPCQLVLKHPEDRPYRKM